MATRPALAILAGRQPSAPMATALSPALVDRTPATATPPQPVRARRRFAFPYPASLVLLGGAYLAAAKLALLAAVAQRVVSSVWLPSGIALAGLLLWGVRLWPAIWLGAFLLNATTGVPPAAAAVIALGNTLEAVLGAMLLTRVARLRPALDRLRDVLALVGLGALLAPAVAATIGTAGLAWAGQSTAQQHSLLWLVWWSGDALGVLTVAPLLLTWVAGPPLDGPPRARMIEATALAVVLGVALRVLFITPLPYVYLVFPIGAWAALRFGPRGAATATLAVCVVTVSDTLRGQGPFVASSPLNNLFLLQAFIALLAVTKLSMAAMLAERQGVQTSLRALSRRLLHAQELERVRIARELHDQVGQALGAARLHLERLEFASPPGGAVAESAGALERAVELVRTLSFELRPAVLDELDLAAAVRSYAGRLVERAGLELRLEIEELRAPADKDVEVVCFRILQEALANVIVHARADRVLVALRADRRVLRLEVRDDGVGFVPAPREPAGQRLGLLGMSERASAVGGEVRVQSRPGVGTAVTARLPLWGGHGGLA